MPNDRELLEMAAKAAGYHIHVWGTPGAENVARMDDPGRPRWNPLTDDGDALRLAVKLGISIDPGADHVCAITAGHKHVVIEHGDGCLLLPATRRAIVRAAAEIGRANQSKKTQW